MGSNVVVPFRNPRTGPKKEGGDQRSENIGCWRRLYKVIQEIADEELKQEAMEFWNRGVPKILYGP